MLKMKSFKIRWDEIPETSYLRGLTALKDFDGMTFQKNITLFCGENGTGKSTILRALAESWGLNPHGGTKNYISKEEDRSELSDHLDVAKGDASCFRCFFRSDSFLETAREMENFWRESGMYATYGDREIDCLSHGESFHAFLNEFRPNGLYFLDEPDGAFSAQNLLVFMSKIIELAENGCQFVIATHSPLLLGLPDSEIYCFDEEGIHLCDYENTDAYQITKAFINNRERMLRYLCEK